MERDATQADAAIDRAVREIMSAEPGPGSGSAYWRASWRIRLPPAGRGCRNSRRRSGGRAGVHRVLWMRRAPAAGSGPDDGRGATAGRRAAADGAAPSAIVRSSASQSGIAVRRRRRPAGVPRRQSIFASRTATRTGREWSKRHRSKRPSSRRGEPASVTPATPAPRAPAIRRPCGWRRSRCRPSRSKTSCSSRCRSADANRPEEINMSRADRRCPGPAALTPNVSASAAQDQPPAPASQAGTKPKPAPPTEPASPDQLAAPRRGRTAQLANIRVELTITDQTGHGEPAAPRPSHAARGPVQRPRPHAPAT